MSRYSFDKEIKIHAVKYGGRAFSCKGSALFDLQHVKLKINFKIVEQKYIWFNRNV